MEEFWRKPFAARAGELLALVRAGKGDTPEADLLRDALNADWVMMSPQQWEWAEQILAPLELRRG